MGIQRAVTSIAVFVGVALSQAGSLPCSFVPGSPVNTTSGLVHGHRAPNATQVSEYLGIPFAQPPVGQLRFAPPVRYTGTGDLQGDVHGHDCPSAKTEVPTFLPPNVFHVLGQLAQTNDNQQEDCLYVNVWSKPQVGEKSNRCLFGYMEVVSFNSGGTNSSAYSGQFWAETEDVVFVNFNYRLNIFGFPGGPGLTQNLGFLDQRMAIEWVRDNIQAFGGDPSRITIFGQSAGGASVDFYNYAWTEDPIIAGSIEQSGTAISFGSKLPASAAMSWYDVASKLGCGDNTTAEDQVLQCMRSDNTTMMDLIQAEAGDAGLAAVLGNFGPTIDNKTVFANYTDLASQGKFIQVPSIIGNNDYEAGLFILIAAGAGENIAHDIWLDFDAGEFTCPASTAAEWRHAAGLLVWRYRYFGMFPNLELPTSPHLAWHGAELLPMFSSSEEVTQQDSTWQERELGSYMRGAWAAFARCPKSGLTAYGWPEYINTTTSLVQLGMNNATNVPSFNTSSAYDGMCGSFPYNGAPNM